MLDRDSAERFLRILAGGPERLGARDIKLSGVQQEATPAPAPRPGEHPAAGFLAKLPSNGRRSSTDGEEIEAALRRRGNADLDYDEWIKIGLAIKAALPGSDGQALWEWWSSLSSKNDPHVTRKKWGTFKPERVTAATLFWGIGR